MTPRPQPPDPLREILRRGDPAVADPALDAADAGRIRRAVLASLAERARGGRRLAPLPALAGALAVLALAVVVGVPWWRQRSPGASEPAASGAAPALEVAAAPLAPEPSTRPGTAEPGPAIAIDPGPRAAPRVAPENPPNGARAPAAVPARAAAPGPGRAIETPAPGAAAERQRRRIEFAAPGGTRVVWVLDTGFTL